MVASSTPTPPQWPKECNEQYAPVRVVGTGGFGSVWMAKRKDANAANNGSGDTHVAIKIVGKDTYAQREVEILHALSQKQHPNIMRLLQDFSSDEGKDHFIVLSLARGPTLQYVLNKEGGFGLKIAQCISKQLISAISFLHGHAVIHRDISPANLIVSGAMLQDSNWWSDEFDADEKVLALTRKCKITLIDFGFAIALTPEDIQEGATPKADENQSRGRSRNLIPRHLDDSCTRQVLRDLSPLGTRIYAAPEILSGIKDAPPPNLDSSCRRRLVRRKSSTKCTNNYGMIADAYSVGSTISHMITGIPPNQDPDEFFAARNNPVKKFASKMKKRMSGGKAKTSRTKIYRQRADLPFDINEVITQLTHYDASRRCTVRNAMNMPWIKKCEGGETSITEEYPCMKSGNAITYLSSSITNTSETEQHICQSAAQ
eukprot:CAMPEP_0201718182 /NCGR_PEP_ID=MMETSP0593-20130828/3747_1 /ASSEMBLY_ACC=CAM_ASM_000672 /TAXON_ID=267983 /ORGANISM="Skeletonema japonicum, Strain CCMP2506" /LENGTH=429 /DNA_ID=CAMNT_0048208415 /DNA_START=32 /DNA_END=1321 /DNA_ORIENTATION=+